MKTKILSLLDPIPYFTIEAVKQILGDEPIVAGTIPTALYRWMKSGHIIQIKKGVYMTRRFFERHREDADFGPMISAILIPQSYLSLEYVLQHHAILTEITHPVTAVTLKQTRVFNNFLGTFTYRNLKSSLYMGFTITEYQGIPIARASVAKALFDYLYFRARKVKGLPDRFGFAENFRLNLDDISKKDQEEFIDYVKVSKSKKMEWVLKDLRATVWRH